MSDELESRIGTAAYRKLHTDELAELRAELKQRDDSLKAANAGWNRANARAEKAEAELADANKHREFLVMAIDVVRKERDEARADYDIERRQHDPTKADNVALRTVIYDLFGEAERRVAPEFRKRFHEAKRALESSPDPGAKVRAVYLAAIQETEIEKHTDPESHDMIDARRERREAVRALRGKEGEAP